MKRGSASGRSFAVAAVAAVLTVVLVVAGAGSAGTPRPTLVLSGVPSQVTVGHPIMLTLWAKNVSPVAGFQSGVFFDESAAHLVQVWNPTAHALAQGKRLVDLGPLEVSNGYLFGSYTCAATDCTQAAHAPVSAHGNVALAKIELRADKPGTLQLRFSGTQLVDASGASVGAAGANNVVTVKVKGVGGKPHVAPAAGQFGHPSAKAHKAVVKDATGDGRLNEADVAEAALRWNMARMDGAACGDPHVAAALDTNGDGCLDIADVQSFATAVSKLALVSEQSVKASTTAAVNSPLVVNSTGDADDALPGNGVCATSTGTCTLRAAIDEANARSGADTINFNIAGSGVQTIQLASALPTLSDTTGGTTIDGYTQPGAAANTAQFADNAQIKIQIRGTGASGVDGMMITSANNVLRGLSFFNLRRVLYLYHPGANNNAIVGDFVGTDAGGTFGHTASDTYASGIAIEAGAANNTVGAATLADRNVISGNSRHGIVTYNEDSNNNTVYNNIIGLSPDGTQRIANLKHGIDINAGSSFNIIGGTGPLQRNVISGNGLRNDPDGPAGVEVSHATDTTGNQIVGNYFGTDVTGATAASWTWNGLWGIHLEDGTNNTIVRDNVIVNSQGGGIKIQDPDTHDNTVTNNKIGVTATGQAGPNSVYGVLLAHGTINNTIGPGNTIANNPVGVWVTDADTDFNKITQNSIFSNSGLGIDLDPFFQVNPNDPGDVDTGSNQQLNYPEISDASPTSVRGTACAGCTVEVFIADSTGPGSQSGPSGGAYGEGKTYLASATADGSGNFNAAVSGVSAGQWVTTTATDSSGDTSEFSQNVQVITGSASPPSAPSLTSATGGPSDIALQWNPPSSNGGSTVQSYKIYRGTSTGSETLLTTTASDATSYDDTSVSQGTTYFYQVSAINAAGEGPRSNERSAAATGSGLIASDRFNRTVSAGFGNADIGGPWTVSVPARTKVANGQGIMYGWTAGNQDTQASLAVTRTDTESLAEIVLDSANPTGSSYQPRVVARAQADPRNGYVARVVHLPSGGVNWALARVDNAGGTGSLNLGNGTLITSGGAGTKWWIRLRVQGTTISARFWRDGTPEPSAWTAQATDSYYASGTPALGVYAGSGLTSPFPTSGFESLDVVDLNSSSPPTTTAPSAPTLTSATAGNSSVALQWSPPSSNGGAAITNYKVYRGTSSGTETLVATLGNVTSYSDTGLTNGTTYFYEVAAVNSVGTGPQSNEQSATPQATATAPGAPNLTSASAGNASVSLQWSAPASDGGSAITNYKVYRGTSSGTETLVATLGNVTSYSDTGLTNGTTYFYKVAAVNSVGTGPQSNEQSATPQATATAPGAPNLTSASAGNASVSLQWSAPASDGGSAITNYKVYRGTSSGTETLVATLGNVTSYSDTGLTNGTTYFYKVAAVNSVGTGPQSNEQSATPQATTSSTIASDAFSRTVAAGFGNADTGGAWSVSNSARTKVDGSQGVIYGFSAGNQDVQAWLPSITRTDTETLAEITLNSTDPVGGNYQARIVARAQADARNGYYARVVHTTSGGVNWGLNRIDNAGGTGSLALGSGTLLASGGAGTKWWVRLRVQGTSIKARFWRDGTTEPSTWTVTVTDSYWASGTPSVGVFLNAGATTFPSIGFDNLSVVDLSP